jgi:hypothetical protein
MGDASQEMLRRSWMTINLIPFHEDIQVTGSFTLLKPLMMISCNKVPIECRYADTQCIVTGMVPATSLPCYNTEYIPD